jgi:hypothetical protein
VDAGYHWYSNCINFGLIIDMVLPGWGIIAYIIATAYVGYSVAGGYMNGAIHGALVGVVAAYSPES